MRAPKPRVAENAKEFWEKAQYLMRMGVVTENQGICYPVLYDFENHYSFVSGGLVILDAQGITYRSPTEAELNRLHRAIDRDTIELAVYGRWGGSGRDIGRRKLSILHSPSGMSWNTEF